MTHFVGLVVADTEAELAALLQPFHEYECTGIRDQYVVEVDITDETRAEYEARDKRKDPRAFGQWAAQWTGLPFTHGPHAAEESNAGFIALDGRNNVLRIVKRTNPNAKWDWWVVGGRWSGEVPRNHCRVEDISHWFREWLPSLLIDNAGWHAEKEWGWFGISKPTTTPNVMVKKMAEHADKVVWVVDFHI